MKTLGEQVRQFREAKRWTSTQMGEAVGTSRQNIESLEASGNRIPKYIGPLAAVMGTTVDNMLMAAGLTAPRQLAPVWPFQRVAIERFLSLTPEERAFVEGSLDTAIRQCEAPESSALAQHSIPRPASPKAKRKPKH